MRRVTREARRLLPAGRAFDMRGHYPLWRDDQPGVVGPGSGAPCRGVFARLPVAPGVQILRTVQQLAVYSTLAMTVGLVAVRPSWGARPLSPALIAAAGVLLCVLFGAIG